MSKQEINVIVTVKSLEEIFFQVAPIPKSSLETIKTFRRGKILAASNVKCENCSDNLEVNFFWTHAPLLNEPPNVVKQEVSVTNESVKIEDALEADQVEEEYLLEMPEDDNEDGVEVFEEKTDDGDEIYEYEAPVQVVVQHSKQQFRRFRNVDGFCVPDSVIVKELETSGVCDFCGFTRKKQGFKKFLRHCANHLIQKRDNTFACRACGEIFDSFDATKIHALCCNARESYRDQWEEMGSEEELTKTSENRVACHVCAKVVIRRHMKIHLRTHEKGEHPYYCNECGNTYGGIIAVKNHLISKHFPHLAKHKCSYCPSPRYFLERKRFISHLLTKHQIGKSERLKCPHCDQYLANKNTLKAHILNTHKDPSERNQYRCKHCDKVFYGKVPLKTHEMIHLPDDQKPFRCHICGKAFISSYRHKNHILEHTNPEKVLKRCEICGKGFKYSNSLKVHMRLHTGEKPYECKICNRKFSDRGHYRIHMKQHESNLGVKLTLTSEERRLVNLRVYQPEELVSAVVFE